MDSKKVVANDEEHAELPSAGNVPPPNLKTMLKWENICVKQNPLAVLDQTLLELDRKMENVEDWLDENDALFRQILQGEEGKGPK